jgi:phosphoenolpyruvate synthase/pyruvate phosphate dikinase
MVIQVLVDADVAGVLFTRKRVDGGDERVAEASWGVGETVVTGGVVPGRFRISRSGDILERTAGTRTSRSAAPTTARRTSGEGRPSSSNDCTSRTLSIADLGRLADRCEEVFGPSRDIEWAIAGGTLHLLQCRPMTRTADAGRASSG